MEQSDHFLAHSKPIFFIIDIRISGLLRGMQSNYWGEGLSLHSIWRSALLAAWLFVKHNAQKQRFRGSFKASFCFVLIQTVIINKLNKQKLRLFNLKCLSRERL